MKGRKFEDVTWINRMADGSIITTEEEMRAYLKSPDQLPPLSRRLIAQFYWRGVELAKKNSG